MARMLAGKVIEVVGEGMLKFKLDTTLKVSGDLDIAIEEIDGQHLDSLKQMLSGLADIDEPQQDNESNEVPDSGEKKSFPQSRRKIRRSM